MKNLFKLLGTIALCVLVVFSMTACEEDGGGGGLSISGGGGGVVTIEANSLELTGQVFTLEDTMSGYKFKEFKGNQSLKAVGGGSGSITGGVLSYTINVPSSLRNLQNEFNYFLYDDWDNVMASKTNVNSFSFDTLLKDSSYYEGVDLIKIAFSGNLSNFNITKENITFIYVDKAVTISGSGKTETQEYGGDSWTEVSKDFTVELTAGWNAICKRVVHGSSDVITKSISKMSPNDTSFTWVLEEW